MKYFYCSFCPKKNNNWIYQNHLNKTFNWRTCISRSANLFFNFRRLSSSAESNRSFFLFSYATCFSTFGELPIPSRFPDTKKSLSMCLILDAYSTLAENLFPLSISISLDLCKPLMGLAAVFPTR